MTCWICDDPHIVYTDVLDMGWCKRHYNDVYLVEGDEDEFLQCPHEVIRATCVGFCNCACDSCLRAKGSAK